MIISESSTLLINWTERTKEKNIRKYCRVDHCMNKEKARFSVNGRHQLSEIMGTMLQLLQMYHREVRMSRKELSSKI